MNAKSLARLALVAAGVAQVSPAQIVATEQDQLQDLIFPNALELEGGTLLLGQPSDNTAGSYAGAASVAVRSGATWSLAQFVLAADAAAGDRFGTSVALDGDRFVVGSPRDDGTGSAYVFERAGTTWTQVAKLQAGDGMPDDRFGTEVALDGGRIAVSAPEDDDGGASSGSVYVFSGAGSSWTLEALLRASDDGPGRHFGSALSLDGDRLAVGADADAGTPAPGAAYVFERTGSAWTEQQRLASGSILDERFGAAVALEGATLAVGAPRDAEGALFPGSVYVFAGTGSGWSPQERLVASDYTNICWDQPFYFGEYGEVVRLDGDRLLVGAPGATGVRPFHFQLFEGAGYVYERAGTVWTERAILKWSSIYGADSQLMGAGDIEGDLVVGRNQASVLTYELDRLPQTFCSGKPNSLGCVPFLSTYGYASETATGFFRVFGNDLVPDQPALLLWGLGASSLPFHGGTLCVKAPLTRLLAKSLDDWGDPPCSGSWFRNFNSVIQSGASPALTAGATVYAQVRQRDPVDPAGFGDSLTDGVTFTVGP